MSSIQRRLKELEAAVDFYQKCRDMGARALDDANGNNDPARLQVWQEQQYRTNAKVSVFSAECHDKFDVMKLSDKQFEQYWEIIWDYEGALSIYGAMQAFIWFYQQKISPPVWVMAPLASGLSKHLENPDPELLANQLGVSSGISGKGNPHKEYLRLKNEVVVMSDMATLIYSYGMSKMDAARAVKLKYKLRRAPKTLTNNYRDHYRFSMRDNKISDVTLNAMKSEYGRSRDPVFVQSFPVDARILINKKAPGKT